MKSSHILGLNSRNHLYLSRFNRKSGKRIADSKLLTKKFLKKLKLPHPALIASFSQVADVNNFDWNSLEDNFVIKPAGGYAGEGIILVRKRLGIKKALVSAGSFASVENHLDDYLTRQRSKPILSMNTAFVKSRAKKLWSRRRDLHPHRYADEGSSLLYDLRRHAAQSNFIVPQQNYKYQLMDGSILTLDDLKLHILDILAGRFDKYDLPGAAMIEDRVKKHPRFKRYAYQGTPDVRVIVFNKVPVMAMLRLPTPESRGRANLHQGAIGVGIDLATGITTSAVRWDKPIKTIDDRRWKVGVEGGKSKIEKSNLSSTFNHLPPSSILHHPSSNLKLNGLRIPWWDQILQLAIQVQTIVPLGYMAVDFLLDPDKGPLVIELTARPGMGIQIANQAGLARRLERVEGLDILPGKGIEVAKALFAERFSDKVIAERGAKIVSVFETVKLKDAKGIKRELPAKIDTGAFRSSIDRELAESLGLMKNRAVLWHDYYVSSLGREKRPVISVTFWLSGRKIETTANVSDRSKMKEKLLIGRRDLGTFVIKVNG